MPLDRPLAEGDAIIRVAFNIDPDTLCNTEWVKLVKSWEYIEAIKQQMFMNSLRKVLGEVLEAMYGKKG